MSSFFCFSTFAQTEVYNDTFAVYKTLLDSILNDEKVIGQTAGRVVYADIYGNYDARRQVAIEEMEAQGSLFVLWVEPERYQKSVVSILREHGIDFDTIRLEDIVWTRQVDLQSLFRSRKFVNTHKTPIGYSSFNNLFKEKRVVRISELSFIRRLDVAVAKVQLEKRSNKNEWFEMIVLRKGQNSWKVLARTKSS